MISLSDRLARARTTGRRAGWRFPAAVLLITVLAAGLLAVAWLEARQVGSQSDSASVALQAWAVLHGNLLLRGWRTADLSFYTTELPVYVLVEAVRGLNAGVPAIVEAINYTLLVTGAALVAKGGARGRAGLARAAIAVTVMLAPSLVAAQWLLYGADHAATAIWILLALGVLQRAGRRWYGPALAGLILAWAAVGDPLVQVIGAVPLALAGLVRVWRPDGAGAVRWVPPPRERWYELSLVVAAGASAAAAHAATELISAAGGWQVVSSGERFVAATSLPSNIAVEAGDFLGLFSADFFGQKVDSALVPVLVHLAAAAVVAAAIVVAFRRFGRGGDLTTDVLVAAIACNLLAYLLLYKASPGQIREVSPVFALGAALGGRVLGGPLVRARAQPLLAAGVVAFLLTLGPAVTGRAVPPQTQPLERWLTAHHLTSGLAGYWQANGLVLASAGGGRPAVTVRSVDGRNGRPVPYIWESYLPAYRPASGRADFLVLTTGVLAAHPAITVAGAARELGAPAHVYRFRQYTILTWHQNILRRLP